MIEGLLPCNLEAERLVLGSIFVDSAANLPAAAYLTVEDFSLESHRRIYSAIRESADSGVAVDRVTVANELDRRGQLKSVTVTYLVSLDDGLPKIYNLDSYVRILDECACRRQFMYAADSAITAVGSSDADSSTVAREIARLSGLETKGAAAEPVLLDVAGIVERQGGLDSFFGGGNTGKIIPVPFARLQIALAGGFRPGQLIAIGARPAVGMSALAVQLALYAAEPAIQRRFSV